MSRKRKTDSEFSLRDAARDIGNAALKSGQLLTMVYGRKACAAVSAALTFAAAQLAAQAQMDHEQFIHQANEQWARSERSNEHKRE